MDEQDERESPAGEAACWIGLLCPECGAVPEGTTGPEDPCWRCGAIRAREDEREG